MQKLSQRVSHPPERESRPEVAARCNMDRNLLQTKVGLIGICFGFFFSFFSFWFHYWVFLNVCPKNHVTAAISELALPSERKQQQQQQKDTGVKLA